jgi:hypothetical protein
MGIQLMYVAQSMQDAPFQEPMSPLSALDIDFVFHTPPDYSGTWVVTTAAWAVVLNIKPEQSIITFFHFNVN